MEINFNDLISFIPELMKYFIPGYITILLIKHFNNQSSKNEKSIFLISIVISFIINIFYESGLYVINILYNWMFKNQVKMVFSDNVDVFILLIIGIIISIIIVRYIQVIDSWINKKIFKSKLTTYETVWDSVMAENNKVWVRVYLTSNDIGYVGKLMKYSTSGNEKEIYLTSFTSFNISNLSVIDDFSLDPTSKVYISCKDISNIEILN